MRGAWLFAALLGTAFAQVPGAWTPEFSMQFKTVGGVIPSPDGSRVAWTQTQSVMEPEHSETLTQIFLANADGSHRVQLTRGEKSSAAALVFARRPLRLLPVRALRKDERLPHRDRGRRSRNAHRFQGQPGQLQALARRQDRRLHRLRAARRRREEQEGEARLARGGCEPGQHGDLRDSRRGRRGWQTRRSAN